MTLPVRIRGAPFRVVIFVRRIQHSEFEKKSFRFDDPRAEVLSRILLYSGPDRPSGL